MDHGEQSVFRLLHSVTPPVSACQTQPSQRHCSVSDSQAADGYNKLSAQRKCAPYRHVKKEASHSNRSRHPTNAAQRRLRTGDADHIRERWAGFLRICSDSQSSNTFGIHRVWLRTQMLPHPLPERNSRFQEGTECAAHCNQHIACAYLQT